MVSRLFIFAAKEAGTVSRLFVFAAKEAGTVSRLVIFAAEESGYQAALQLALDGVAEDGGMGGKGIWKPATTGMTPGNENDAMKKYLSGEYDNE